VVKGHVHIANQEVGGKLLLKADNVISAGNFFDITFSYYQFIKKYKKKFKNRKTLIKNNTIYRHEKLQ
jgi:hypothetical protein